MKDHYPLTNIGSRVRNQGGGSRRSWWIILHSWPIFITCLHVLMLNILLLSLHLQKLTFDPTEPLSFFLSIFCVTNVFACMMSLFISSLSSPPYTSLVLFKVSSCYKKSFSCSCCSFEDQDLGFCEVQRQYLIVTNPL